MIPLPRNLKAPASNGSNSTVVHGSCEADLCPYLLSQVHQPSKYDGFPVTLELLVNGRETVM